MTKMESYKINIIYTRRHLLFNPLENSSFQTIHLDPLTSEKVNNYSITAKYHTGKIKLSNNKFDINGFSNINGQLKNNGTEVKNVKVITTICDIDSKVTGLTKAINELVTILSNGVLVLALVVT